MKRIGKFGRYYGIIHLYIRLLTQEDTPMPQNQYREHKDLEYDLKSKEILNELPSYIDDYYTSLMNSNGSAGTRLNYLYDIRLFFRYLATLPRFENIDIRDISLKDLDSLEMRDIEHFLAALIRGELQEGKRKTNSANTRARKLSSIRSLYTYFGRDGRLKTNPAALVETPKIKQQPVVYLNKEDVAEMLKVAYSGNGMNSKQLKYHELTKLRDIAIITLLFGTGMRVSECVGIDLEHINFKNNFITIIRKGGDEDKVYFNQSVKDALLDYINFGRLGFNPYDEYADALFLATSRKRITTRSVENLIHKYATLANLDKNIAPHKCRSTYACYVYEATGHDLYAVKDSLHHASLETSKRYIGDAENRKKKAAKSIDGLFD